jgi:spermidine synthase
MRILAERDGLFGPIRVMERQDDRARLYCINASVQTMVRRDGVSVFGYVHTAKLLLEPAQSVLVIGGAGGSLATMLARRGKDVTVVDIDPAAEELARTYFDLDDRVQWVTAEALAFIARAARSYDGAVIDACDANGLVEPFADPATLHSILTKTCPDGSLVINLVHEDDAPPRGEGLARELAQRGLTATLYRAEDGWEGNEVLHVRAQGKTDTLVTRDLHGRPDEVLTYLTSLRAVTPLTPALTMHTRVAR